jgi:hypothetical protein
VFRFVARLTEAPSEAPAKHPTVSAEAPEAPSEAPCTLPAVVEDGEEREDDGRFNWCDPELVTLPGTAAISVYPNRYRQIVIRAEAGPDIYSGGGMYRDSEDNFIVVNPRDVWILIDRLRALADALRRDGNEDETEEGGTA